MKIKKHELEKAWTILKIPFFSFLAAVFVVLVLLLLNSDKPFESLCSFFAVPFSASYWTLARNTYVQIFYWAWLTYYIWDLFIGGCFKYLNSLF